MIDMHIHTKYSDGTYSPKELLERAEKLGLKRATNNQIKDGYKYCSLCKVEHPIAEFYKNRAI